MTDEKERYLELEAKFKPSLDLEFKKFVAAGPTLERGGYLEAAWVATATGLDDPWRIMPRIRKWYLREHGIHTRKRGEGIYLETEEDQVNICAEDARRRLVSTARNGGKRVGVVDPHHLTERTRNKQESYVEYLARVKLSADEQAKRKEFKPGETKRQITG